MTLQDDRLPASAWGNPIAVGLAAAVVAWHARYNLLTTHQVGSFQGTPLKLLETYVVVTTLLCAGILVLEAALLFLPEGRNRMTPKIQTGLVLLLFLAGVIAPGVARTVGRLKYGSERMVLDSAVQMEVAAEMLVQGKNPYAEDFHGTAVARWHRYPTAPALYHFVYPPFGLLLTVPLQKISKVLFGVYDQRFLLIPCLALAFLLAARWLGQEPWRPAILAAVFLNPLVAPSFERGRLEALVVLLLVLLLESLRREKWGWAGLLLGLAVMTKTTFLPMIPFAILYVARRRGWTWSPGGLVGLLREGRVTLSMCASVMLLLLAPFLMWNAGVYVEDTWLSLSGRGAHPFLIDEGGYFGVGSLVLRLGWVKDPGEYVPFWMVQLPICLGLVGIALRHLHEKPSLPVVMGGFVIVGMAYLYFSRFCDPAYFGSLASYVPLACGFRTSS